MEKHAASRQTSGRNQRIFVDGKLVYECPKAMDIQAYCNREKDTLWEEQKRLKNPDIVPVDLSDKLSAMKLKLIEAATMI